MSKATFPSVASNIVERKEHILSATARVIAKKGFSGLTMRLIASEAGCSRGLVEHYFKNKEVLINRANEWANTSYQSRVSELVGDQQGLPALKIRIKDLLPYSKAVLDEWRVRVAFWQEAVTHPRLDSDVKQSLYDVYEAILADINYAQSVGEISESIPVQVVAETVVIMITGIATISLNDRRLRESSSLDKRVEMIMGIIKSGGFHASQGQGNKEKY